MRAVDEPQRTELQKICAFIKRVVPETTEGISYGMPAFKYKGKPLVYVGAFKDHMSLFPTSGPIEELHEELKSFKVAKGTIHFTLEKPLPEKLIKKILQYRIAQIENG